MISLRMVPAFPLLVDAAKAHVPVLWLWLFMAAGLGHFIARLNAFPHVSLDDYAIVDSPTIFSYQVHRAIDLHRWLIFVYLAMGLLLAAYINLRQHSRITSFFIFLPLNAFAVLYFLTCARLGTKFVYWY